MSVVRSRDLLGSEHNGHHLFVFSSGRAVCLTCDGERLLEAEDRADPGSLRSDELVVACRNVNVDITCGACASLFYTGYGGHAHDEGCRTGRF